MPGIDIIPSGRALGAELRGIDLRHAIDDAAAAEIEAAWNELAARVDGG